MTNITLKIIFGITCGHCHFCGDKLIFSSRAMKKSQPEQGAWEVDHCTRDIRAGTLNKDFTETRLPRPE